MASCGTPGCPRLTSRRKTRNCCAGRTRFGKGGKKGRSRRRRQRKPPPSVLSIPARRIKLPVKAPRGRPRGIRKRPAPCGTQAPIHGTGGSAVTRLHRILFYVAAVSLTSLAANPPAAADAPPVRILRTQRGGDVTDFQVRFDPARDLLRLPPLQPGANLTEAELRNLGRLPRLVPQDKQTRAVYLRLESAEGTTGPGRDAGKGALEFLGRWQGDGTSKEA